MDDKSVTDEDLAISQECQEIAVTDQNCNFGTSFEHEAQ